MSPTMAVRADENALVQLWTYRLEGSPASLADGKVLLVGVKMMNVVDVRAWVCKSAVDA